MTPASRDLYANRVAYGNALIRTAIDQAVGWMPGDVALEQQAFPGRPAVELASVAWGGDLLVFGSRHRGWLRRLAPGSVARACARRADCPVVIVPEPLPSVLQASLQRLRPRPPVPVGAAPRSADGFVTISRAGPGSGLPTLSDVFRVIIRYPVGRWALFALWLSTGWHFFVRGWHFLLRA